jgi:hypothetical protein
MNVLRPSKLRLRWLTAVCLAVIAGVHIAIAPEHLHEAPYAGVLFLVLAAATLAAAGLVLTTDHPLVWIGTAGLSLSALVAYLVSRSVGLPSLSDDIGDWLNPLGVVAVVSETAVVLIAGYVQLGGRRYRIVTATERLYTVVPASAGKVPTVG